LPDAMQHISGKISLKISNFQFQPLTAKRLGVVSASLRAFVIPCIDWGL